MTGSQTEAPVSVQVKEARLVARQKAMARELLERHNLKICHVCGRLAFQSGCIDKHCTNYYRRSEGKDTNRTILTSEVLRDTGAAEPTAPVIEGADA